MERHEGVKKNAQDELNGRNSGRAQLVVNLVRPTPKGEKWPLSRNKSDTERQDKDRPQQQPHQRRENFKNNPRRANTHVGVITVAVLYRTPVFRNTISLVLVPKTRHRRKLRRIYPLLYLCSLARVSVRRAWRAWLLPSSSASLLAFSSSCAGETRGKMVPNSKRRCKRWGDSRQQCHQKQKHTTRDQPQKQRARNSGALARVCSTAVTLPHSSLLFLRSLPSPSRASSV